MTNFRKPGVKRSLQTKSAVQFLKRPGLAKLKELLRPNDVIEVWRLDRLGRSLKHLIDWFKKLGKKSIEFQSLHEKIETCSPTGKLVFHLFGALTEFERNLIQERTQAGLSAARSRGRLGGRPKSLDLAKRSIVLKLYKDRESTVHEICSITGISKPTLYKYLREQN